jgi:hypothetical protein
MTIDERLERLTERHEALAQTVELMGHEMREMFAATNKALEKLAEVSQRTTESILALVQVAQSHDARLSRLEGK